MRREILAPVAFALALGTASGCNLILGMDEGEPTGASSSGGGANTTASSSSSTGPGDPKWACVGHVEAADAVTDYGLQLKDGNKTPEGLAVKLCAVSDDNCTIPLKTYQPDPGDGTLVAQVPKKGAYLDVTGATYKPMLLEVGPPSKLTHPLASVNVISEVAFATLLAFAHITEDPTRGTVIVAGVDCDGATSEGVSFSCDACDAGTFAYYETGMGSKSASEVHQTDKSGTAGFINVPAGAVQIQSTRVSDGLVIGTATIHVRPETVTILRLEPTPTPTP